MAICRGRRGKAATRAIGKAGTREGAKSSQQGMKLLSLREQPTSPCADVRALQKDVNNGQLSLKVGEPVMRPFNWDRDAETVIAFQEDNFSLNFSDFIMTHRFEESFRADLRRAANDRSQGLFVIEVDGQLVAFLWLVILANNWTGERYGYINNLYVRPEFRHQGLGTQCMEKAESFFRSRGIRKVRLTVSCGNAAAVSLYQKMGYGTIRFDMEKEIK